MEFIDTHTHNYDEAFDSEEESVIRKCTDSGVVMMLQPDIDSSERERMLTLVDRHPECMRPMIGLYPGSVGIGWKEGIERMTTALKGRSDVVAIGEIGLDYHFSKEFMEEQKEAFRLQLELALKMGLPVNIHLRDATEDFFILMEDFKGKGLRGNLHAFSGSYETFQRLSRIGDFYVGIGGVVTFKNSSLPSAVEKIPLDSIVLETDAPYLAPTPLRGTRNDSSNLPLIAGAIAEIKKTDIETVAFETTRNARRLFGL